MNDKKKRKPRGIKLNGMRSYDMCTGCYMPFCDPFAASPEYRYKIGKRLEAGLCPACGREKCRCKSSILSAKQFEERERNRLQQRHEFLSNL